MSEYNSNDNLAMALKNAMNNPVERDMLLGNYPELKCALAFYEKNERYFNQNASSNKHTYILLKALKDNICFQLQEDGPTSFDEVPKIYP